MKYLTLAFASALLAVFLLFIEKPEIAFAKCQQGGESPVAYSYKQGAAASESGLLSLSFDSHISGCRDGEHYVEPNRGVNATAYLFQSLDQDPITSLPVTESDTSGNYKAEFALPQAGTWWVRILIDGEEITAPSGADLLLWEVRTPVSSVGNADSMNIPLMALGVVGSIFAVSMVGILLRRRSILSAKIKSLATN